MAKSPSHGWEMGGFYLIFWLRNYPHATGTRPGVEVRATFRTVMLRIRDDKIPRTPHVESAQVVQRPMRLLVPRGRVTTTRTRLPRVVATVQDDLGLRQVCERCHTFGRVGAIRTWAEHRVALLAQKLGPELYDKGLLGATRYPRYSLDNCRPCR